MTRVRHRLLVVLCIAAIPGAAWFVRDRLSGATKPAPLPSDYSKIAENTGGQEAQIRDELNDLICTSSAPLDADDAKKVAALTRECLDIKVLLEIKHVRSYLAAANRGEASPYHFVNPFHKARLQALAGEKPSPQKVIGIRKALAKLGEDFAAIRQPPDWTVKVEGDSPPPMPFLDLLREASEFLPPDKQPTLRSEPRFFAFSGAEGELLMQLELFFNSRAAQAAFPASKYPKLYKSGRIPPVPTTLIEYRQQIGDAVVAEQRILLPNDTPSVEEAQAVNEVFAGLEQFFSTIVTFHE